MTFLSPWVDEGAMDLGWDGMRLDNYMEGLVGVLRRDGVRRASRTATDLDVGGDP
jgi:hypothetical protein